MILLQVFHPWRVFPRKTDCRALYPLVQLEPLVAGTGFNADSDKIPLVSVYWKYRGAKQGAKVMQRVGVCH